MNAGRRVMEWAGKHYDEFLVVCGLKNTGTERTTQIWKMLQQDGLEELSEMMAVRMLQFYFEDDPSSMQLEKEELEKQQRKKHSDN